MDPERAVLRGNPPHDHPRHLREADDIGGRVFPALLLLIPLLLSRCFALLVFVVVVGDCPLASGDEYITVVDTPLSGDEAALCVELVAKLCALACLRIE